MFFSYLSAILCICVVLIFIFNKFCKQHLGAKKPFPALLRALLAIVLLFVISGIGRFVFLGLRLIYDMIVALFGLLGTLV